MIEYNWLKTNNSVAKAIPDAFWLNPKKYSDEFGKVLKDSGFHREVLTMDISTTEKVLVKHFQLSSFSEKLKWKLKKSAPQKEWEILNYLINSCVSVPQPVAFGFLKKENGNFDVWLVIEFISSAVTFDKVDPEKISKTGSSAARNLARDIATLHLSDVWHGDLHSGNLLYVPETQKWLITDFQRGKHGHPGRKEFVDDLVQLHHCLGKKVKLKLRLVFLREYFNTFAKITETEEETSGYEIKNLFLEIRNKSRLYSIQQAKSRNSRCEKNNKTFAELRKLIPKEDLPEDFQQAWTIRKISTQLLSDFAKLLKKNDWYLDNDVTIIKNTKSVAVGVWSHPQGNLFVKQYRYRKTISDRLGKLFHKSKAHRAWKSAWQLIHLHIKTAPPVLVALSPRGSFIAHRYLSEVISIETALKNSKTDCQRKKLLRQNAYELALLHDRGAEHGDLKASNILVTNFDNCKQQILLTDIDAVKFYNNIPFNRRIRDLSRFYAALFPFVSNYEVRYFLRIYLKRQAENIELRQIIIAVQDRAEQKIWEKHGLKIK